MTRKWLIAIFGLMSTALSGVALAESGAWATHEVRSGYDVFYDASGQEKRIYFKVEEWDADYDSDLRGQVYAYAFTRPEPDTYLYDYDCTITEYSYEQIEPNRIPNNSSDTKPGRGISYTFHAPACNGYDAAVFRVNCDVNTTNHSSWTSIGKTTRRDGSKTFYMSEANNKGAALNPGTGDYDCSISFDNGTVSLYSDSALASAFKERQREK
jgi:hypothetical protein